MLLITRRLATGLLLAPIGGIRFAAAAPDATARITFILVNDIYLMADELMADGQRRGGFARLAAVVRAERTKANAANHEFDFGKTTFLQRMAEAKFPLYAANLRGPDGHPLPNFKDRSIVSFDGVRIGLTGATYDDSARASDSGDLGFLPTVATLNEQAEALRREGADFVVARGSRHPGTGLPRRRRLHQLPRCQAGPAGRRRADHCLRGHRLHKEHRYNTHRRRWADRIKLSRAFSDLKHWGRLARREFVWINVTAHSTAHRENTDAQGCTRVRK